MLEIRLTRTRVAIDKENHPIGSRKSKGWRSELVSLFSGNFHDQDLSSKLPFASNVGKNNVSQVFWYFRKKIWISGNKRNIDIRNEGEGGGSKAVWSFF